MLGQNLQVALRTAPNLSRSGPQNLLSSSSGFPRQEWQTPGTARNRCFICHETNHFLNQCNILDQYIMGGKMARDRYNMITLGNGDHLPANPLNRPWQVLVDEFYANNPHLLPASIQPIPSHTQANFATNFVQINHSDPLRAEEVESASLLHLAMITEVTDEDKPSGYDSLSEDLEPSHIDQLVEVLQARAKEIRNRHKKSDSGKQAPINPSQPDKIQPDKAQLAQPSLPVPEVVI